MCRPSTSTAAIRPNRSRLPAPSRWWIARHETTRSNGPLGQRILEACNTQVGARQSRLGQHLGARVDAGEVCSRVAGQNPA